MPMPMRMRAPSTAAGQGTRGTYQVITVAGAAGKAERLAAGGFVDGRAGRALFNQPQSVLQLPSGALLSSCCCLARFFPVFRYLLERAPGVWSAHVWC